MSQENLGRADKTIDLLNNDKDRLQKQVSAVSREFEKRVAALEDELESEQNKVDTVFWDKNKEGGTSRMVVMMWDDIKSEIYICFLILINV